MALVTERIEDNVLYLELNGRIDSSNAEQAEALIQAIKQAHPDLHAVLDAEKLEYLSSAGLRVLLAAQKVMNKQGEMVIRHVNDTINEIFDVTGFIDILTIE